MPRRLAPRLAALGVLLSAQGAAAFCRTTTCDAPCQTDDAGCPVSGIPIAWRQRCVSYSVSTDVPASIGYAAAKATIDLSFLAWQTVTCPSGAPASISATDAFGPSACNHVEYSRSQGNANVILFRDATWDYPDAGHALALTTVTYNVRNGDIYDADMEINTPLLASDVAGPTAGAYDLQAVVTHEAGHFFGLAHSEQPGATMLKEYEPNMRSLTPDDIAGICTAYPPDRATGACDPAPRQGFSPECAMDPTVGGGCSTGARPSAGGLGPALVAGALVGLRRRRTRRSAA